MRYIVGLFLILVSVFLYALLRPIEYTTPSLPDPSVTSTAVYPQTVDITSGLFVPYWAIDESLQSQSYDELYYFGIAPDKNGYILPDPGRNGLPTFLHLAREMNSKRFLVIRMLDRDVNNELLKDKQKQQQFISEVFNLSTREGFAGIVLDFEYNALSFDITVNRITDLYENFSQAAREARLLLYVTLYGDTFYRIRPYDVEKIGKFSDRLLIMAYDFHKSRGNAGPNFPMSGDEVYGYDMALMVDNFLHVVPASKLAVVFGMFGYDWSEGSSVAQALTYKQAENRFIKQCTLQECRITEDALSTETKVEYIDQQNKQHTVWFETSSSVEKKEKFLMEKGISTFGYWAYSYF